MMLVFLFVEFLQGVDLFRGCAPQLDNLILIFVYRLVTDYLVRPSMANIFGTMKDCGTSWTSFQKERILLPVEKDGD
jgi:hypothetical protein